MVPEQVLGALRSWSDFLRCAILTSSRRLLRPSQHRVRASAAVLSRSSPPRTLCRPREWLQEIAEVPEVDARERYRPRDCARAFNPEGHHRAGNTPAPSGSAHAADAVASGAVCPPLPAAVGSRRGARRRGDCAAVDEDALPCAARRGGNDRRGSGPPHVCSLPARRGDAFGYEGFRHDVTSGGS